ncbi:MAG: T9SS type A sorting domain-containing protein, partial [Bacteroidia bacterium]
HLTLLFLFFCLSFSLFSQKKSGGPDIFGYIWRNSDTITGPAYAWKDIKAKGIIINGLKDDNTIGPFNIGFSFRYYLTDCDKIWIGSNGYVSFQNGISLSVPFSAIPTSDGTNINFVAGILSDLYPDTTIGAKVYFWTNYSDSVIVQYDSIPFWDTTSLGYIGRNTFQIILSAADSSISFQYKLINGITQNHDLKTGIENIFEQSGLAVLDDTTPSANTTVKFYYPKVVSCDSCLYYDVTPAWNNNSHNGGFFMSAPYGHAITLKSEIANIGKRNAGSFTINAEVLDTNSNLLYNNTITIPRLIADSDTMVLFSSLYQNNSPGRYIYRTNTLFSHDMNNANNIQDVELVVVDTSLATCTLAYDDNTMENSLSWKTNTDGAGIYLEPPFYPAVITSLDYFIAKNPSNSGFIASIRAADGVNNSPGTMLFKDTIFGSSIIANAFHQVPLASPLTINSGGIYIGWAMNGDSISIGTNRNAPLSNRAYEIIGGTWLPYRYRTLEDFMIHVNISGSNSASVNEFINKDLLLSQNFPNPSSGNTTINYTLLSNGEVQFSVRNILGQEIADVNFENQTVGNHSLKLNTEKYSSGIYFYSLKFKGKEITKKMVISK